MFTSTLSFENCSVRILSASREEIGCESDEGDSARGEVVFWRGCLLGS